MKLHVVCKRQNLNYQKLVKVKNEDIFDKASQKA